MEADIEQTRLEAQLRDAVAALLKHMSAAAVELPPTPEHLSLTILAGDPSQIRQMKRD